VNRSVGVFLLGCSLAGCGSSNDVQCNFSTAPASAPADGTITYTASITGDATFASLIYRTQDGPDTVSYPESPFKAQVMVASGLGIGITATGTAKEGGNLVVGYTFSDGTGDSPVVASAQCKP
jgi:hypothetical protein